MSLKIGDFANIQAERGYVKLKEGKVVVYGNRKFWGKFKIGWLKLKAKFLTSAKEANKKVMNSFIQTIKNEYGASWGDLARIMLANDLATGKHLSVRKMRTVLSSLRIRQANQPNDERIEVDLGREEVWGLPIDEEILDLIEEQKRNEQEKASILKLMDSMDEVDKAILKVMLKKYADENIRFMFEVKQFKQMSIGANQSQMLQKAQHIYEKYVKEGAPYQINIEYETRTDIENTLKQSIEREAEIRNIFDNAYKECYQLVKNDIHIQVALKAEISLASDKNLYKEFLTRYKEI
jgi:hypothetical protein